MTSKLVLKNSQGDFFQLANQHGKFGNFSECQSEVSFGTPRNAMRLKPIRKNITHHVASSQTQSIKEEDKTPDTSPLKQKVDLLLNLAKEVKEINQIVPQPVDMQKVQELIEKSKMLVGK